MECVGAYLGSGIFVEVFQIENRYVGRVSHRRHISPVEDSMNDVFEELGALFGKLPADMQVRVFLDIFTHKVFGLLQSLSLAFLSSIRS